MNRVLNTCAAVPRLALRRTSRPLARSVVAPFALARPLALAQRYNSTSAAALDTSAVTAATRGVSEAAAPTDHGESQAPSYPATADPATVDAWKRAGVPEAVAERIALTHPECVAPTPAQLAFLLSIQRGDVDVYLKDYMGRGKTFALVLAALSAVGDGFQVDSKTHGGRGVKAGRVVFVLPTPHLVQQVADLLGELAGDVTWDTATTGDEALDMNARIVVGTPSALLAIAGRKRNMTLAQRFKGVTHVFVDEADTQFGALPPRYITTERLAQHRVNRHPPALVQALNSLLNITEDAHGRLDFSRRKNDVTTVWSSATLNPAVRRFVYQRGWVRGRTTTDDGSYKAIADLDYTGSASARHVELREALGAIAERAGAPSAQPHQVQPEHYAFAVAPTGKLTPIDAAPDADIGVPPHRSPGGAQPRGAPGLPVTLVEALAYLHAVRPPPAGTYALTVVPDGAPLKSVAAELSALGIHVDPLVPETLVGGVPPPPADAPAPILLTTRAALPGLHLPHLHTIYLLNGLDVSHLSKQQRLSGGMAQRETAYAIAAGRLGRFATPTQPDAAPQRIISLVAEGSSEEIALQDLFGGKSGKWQFELSTWPGEL